MEDFARRGPRNEHQQQRHSTSLSSTRSPNGDKGDERNVDVVGGLGTGALQFIRNRGSVRRQLKRDSGNRNKTSNEGQVATLSTDAGGGNNGGGGFGKWLRDHLVGSSRNNQEIVASIPAKNRSRNTSYDLTFVTSDKNLTRTTYTPQNLYCSLPREQHRRHFRGNVGKSCHEMTRERGRCYSGGSAHLAAGVITNSREKSGNNDLAGITRGGPIYGSEGKSSRRREREKRRHSMNETKVHTRHRRIRNMVDTWQKSMESSDLTVVNDVSKIRDTDDEELPSIWESEENQREVWSVELSNGETNLIIDDRMIEETSRVMGEVKIGDDHIETNEELADVIEESEHDEDVENIEKIESREEYEEDFGAGVSEAFFDSREDEDEEEEEVFTTESSSEGREKLDDDVTVDSEPLTSDDFDIGAFSDIPLEILRDRRATLEKLYELRMDEPELRRKNRLLQYWVARVMTKKHQTMTPEDETLIATDTNDRYVKKLISYKTTIDEIEARHAEMRNELEIMENNVRYIQNEDSVSFGQLLAREREIGLGLMYEKSARVIGDNAIEATIRRKVLRRDLLNRERFKYIFLRHRYEDIKMKLRHAEKLGDGMKIIDYEVLRLENESYKEKLEERNKALEKLSIKIENILSTLAHYKEKDFSNLADTYHEKECLEIVRSEALMTRQGLSEMLKLLWRIRNTCVNKKRRAGLLFAIPVLRKMEESIKILDELKIVIERMIREDRSNEPFRRTRNKHEVDENHTTVTRMTRVKSEEPRKMRPGRC